MLPRHRAATSAATAVLLAGCLAMTQDKTRAGATPNQRGHDIAAWLRADVTLTLPRWALVAMRVAALILLLLAFD